MKKLMLGILQGVAIGALLGLFAGLWRAVETISANAYFEYELEHVATKLLWAEVSSAAFWGALVALGSIAVGLLSYPIARVLRGDRRRASGGALASPIVLSLLVATGYRVNITYLPHKFAWISLAVDLAMVSVALVAWFALARGFDRITGSPSALVHLRRAGLLAATATAAILLASFATRWPWPPAKADESRPNVIIVMIDTLRRDRMSLYGHSRATTPGIDDFASRATVFSRAVAQAPWTKPSVASLLTSMYPRQHGITNMSVRRTDERGKVLVEVLDPHAITIAELLSNAGYATAAIGNNQHLIREIGFAQGFDLHNLRVEPDEPRTRAAALYRPFYERLFPEERSDGHRTRAAATNRRFFDWLDRHENGRFFAYLHYIDLHWPYRTAPPFSGLYAGPPPHVDYNAPAFITNFNRSNDRLDPRVLKHMSDTYDEGIRFIDVQIDNLFIELQARKLFDETLIIFVGDHGEEFLEHGRLGHGYSLYTELLSVPLVVKYPCRESACRAERVDEVVELIDVMPTILALVGIAPPRGTLGKPLPSHESRGPTEAVAMSETGDLISLETQTHKYVRGPRGEILFDLRSDHEEMRNQAAENPELIAEFRRRMRDLGKRVDAGSSIGAGEMTASDEMKNQLEALGYVE